MESWNHCILETEDRDEADRVAEAALEGGRFRWVALDRNGSTIWTNDPDTPVSG